MYTVLFTKLWCEFLTMELLDQFNDVVWMFPKPHKICLSIEKPMVVTRILGNQLMIVKDIVKKINVVVHIHHFFG